MITDSEPKKIVLYRDKISGKCLIRVVDDNFDTVLQYGVLPILCSISDLYISIIQIDTAYKTGNKQFYNNKLGFIANSSGVVELCDNSGNILTEDSKMNDFICSVFNVK